MMNPSERQSKSRLARKKAGGKALYVVLTPDAAKALDKLLGGSYGHTLTECVCRALVEAHAIAEGEEWLVKQAEDLIKEHLMSNQLVPHSDKPFIGPLGSAICSAFGFETKKPENE